jgi:DNA polymerase elongation subunit (family B)
MNVSDTATKGSNLKPKPNKKLRIIKMFRMFDFQTYDGAHVEDTGTESSSSDNDSDNGFKNKKKPAAEKLFTIQMFGANEKGETCCIYVTEYKPFFYVKVGDKWGQKEADALIREIKSKIGNPYQNSIISHELVSKHKLYGFSGGKKCNFVKIIFQNMITMNRVQRLWYSYNNNAEENDGEYRKRIKFYFMNVSIELYESNIPPLLRYFHIQNISPSGWVSFYADRVVRVTDKKTTCNFEYICPLAELKPMNDKETRIPYKICSFDIEASSSHGDFPVPVKTYKKLAKNLVDMFLLQRPFLNDTKCVALLECVILTAFGYSSCDNVDIVYQT